MEQAGNNPIRAEADTGPGTGEAGARPLGVLVRARRRGLGLTLTELSARTGCARSTLSAIETGRIARPGDDVLARLEETLGAGLRAAADWPRVPPALRAEMAWLRRSHRDAGALAAWLSERMGAEPEPGAQARAEPKAEVVAPPRGGGAGLDALYRSGALRALIDRLAPRDAEADAEAQDGPGAAARGARASAGTGGGAAASRVSALPAEIPLINRVSAGYPREFTDLGYPARVADEYVRTVDVHDPDAFAARVVGDSMEPGYREGDVVVFSPARPVVSGMDCFARLEPDQETTFKRVYFEHDAAGREVIRLQPLNPRYAPRVIPREGVSGLYAAVSLTRALG